MSILWDARLKWVLNNVFHSSNDVVCQQQADVDTCCQSIKVVPPTQLVCHYEDTINLYHALVVK